MEFVWCVLLDSVAHESALQKRSVHWLRRMKKKRGGAVFLRVVDGFMVMAEVVVVVADEGA